MSVRDEQVGEFDHYARLVRRLLGVPVGLVSLVEPDRQVFVGAIGLPDAYQRSRETPLSHSFCQYVVKDERPLIISDARVDPRLSDNLAIEDLGVVAYAGWPVTDHTGRAIGSLCAIDSVPREWTREDVETLEDLAAACSAELAERQRAIEAEIARESAEEFGEQTRALLTLSTALAATETLADVAAAVVRISTTELGCSHAGLWLRSGVAVGHAAPVASEDRMRSRVRAEPRPETLTYVENSDTWLNALVLGELPLDGTNPLGEALTRRQMVAYESRAAQNLAYPHLDNPEQLGEARAFLPLRLGGRDYGVLALLWPGRRQFTDHDRVNMAALASYTAQAVHRAQLLQQRLDVALTLQHAMLTSLPRPAHLTLTARYRPAGAGEEVGGDWYDALVTPSGTTYVMIGDVAGHDMEAAAVMGQLRSMLRMTAWLSATSYDGTPARELEQLDCAMEGLAVDTVATAVLARIEPLVDGPAGSGDGRRLLRWANAGHLPPVLVEPDGTARLLTGADGNDPMLGMSPDAPRCDQTVAVAPGSCLLLYTDGLVERRGEPLDEGLERLLAAVTRHAARSQDELLDLVLHDLVGDTPTDDVALLAVRFGGE
ncbi:GAF domain-containing SpoIIE family protein phosphatase [Nocardioides sp.]|uniref:GAF domain-containing SpoIIE family protein phosphatase n=1 Tax=Nocardioides sp. TaxID=35761 RepID=UPI002727DB14|nr:SpoIIE family protein phosphatase [Nocardioides sp.]MDO9457684.1 SpoIIE family protein phosphatase [Nocardioides sp.]